MNHFCFLGEDWPRVKKLAQLGFRAQGFESLSRHYFFPNLIKLILEKYSHISLIHSTSQNTQVSGGKFLLVKTKKDYQKKARKTEKRSSCSHAHTLLKYGKIEILVGRWVTYHMVSEPFR
jgi:cytochrome bd-type quinol oxidase subunit 2